MAMAQSNDSKKLKQIGKAMLEYSIFKFDVYEISFHRNDIGEDMLQLVYQRDIKKEHSVMGWEEGMKPLLERKPELTKKFQWFITNTIEMKEKDIFQIRRSSDRKVSLYKNNKLIAEKSDNDIYEMSFYPWLGDKPVDAEIKRKLLNK
jgi:hypothetical protein